MTATAYVSNDGNDYIALAFDDGQGAPTDTADYTFVKWIDGSTGVEHDRVETAEREGGDGQDMALAYVEHHTGRQTIVTYARPEITHRLLAAALGAATITASLGYTHDIWPVNAPRLVTAETAAPGQSIIEQMNGGVISEIVIEAEHGKPLKLTAQYVGGGSPEARSVASARTVSLESDAPFYFNTGSHSRAIAGDLEQDCEITRWTCTFTRALDEDVFGCGYGRRALPALNRNVNVEVTRRYTNATQHNAILYGAGASTVRTTVATGAFRSVLSNGQSGTLARTFQLDIPLMHLSPISRNVFEVDGQTVYEDVAGVALNAGTHLIHAAIGNALGTSVASGIV